MFQCFCNKKFSLRKTYVDHLKQHEILGELRLPVFCNQFNCEYKESFSSFNYLNHHLRKYHDNNSTSDRSHNITTAHLLINNEIEKSCEIMDFKESFSENSNILIPSDEKNTIQNLLKIFENDIFSTMISLKSKSQLSDTLLNEIINIFSKLFHNAIEVIIQLLVNTLSSDNELEQEKINNLKKNINKFKSCFKFIDSSYKQMKLIENLSEYIKPEQILLGQRDDTVFKNGKM